MSGQGKMDFQAPTGNGTSPCPQIGLEFGERGGVDGHAASDSGAICEAATRSNVGKLERGARSTPTRPEVSFCSMSQDGCAGSIPDLPPQPESSPAPATNPTKCDLLRALLSDGQWHHIREMMAQGGTRFGGRLCELRQRGWDHEVETRKDGATWYRKK